MQNMKQNIKTEISKSIKCVKWDIDEVINQINFVFDHEQTTIACSIETLNSISDDIDKIKMLLNLLK